MIQTAGQAAASGSLYQLRFIPHINFLTLITVQAATTMDFLMILSLFCHGGVPQTGYCVGPSVGPSSIGYWIVTTLTILDNHITGFIDDVEFHEQNID